MQQQQPESLFQSIKRVENLPHPIFMGDRNKDPYGPRGARIIRISISMIDQYDTEKKIPWSRPGLAEPRPGMMQLDKCFVVCKRRKHVQAQNCAFMVTNKRSIMQV